MPTIPPRERFLAKIDQATDPQGCWLWRGATCPGPRGNPPYGHFRVANRDYKAHRFAYELFVGPIPPGIKVLHECDVTLCVNPAHLRLGTQGDNVRDMEAKGRSHHPRGSKQGSAKLTEDDVREIRRLHADGVKAKALAARYGVTDVNIYDIVLRHSWRHIA